MGVISSQGERPPQRRLELALAGLTLELLRPLLGLALQVFDLPPHVRELPFLLGVLQAVLFGRAVLGFRNDAGALVVEGAGDRQLQVLLFAFELALPLPDCELQLARLVQFLSLRFELRPQRRGVVQRLLLGVARGLPADTLDFVLQLPVEVLPDRRFDLRPQRTRQGDLLSAGRAGNRLFGHGSSLRRQCSEGP